MAKASVRWSFDKRIGAGSYEGTGSQSELVSSLHETLEVFDDLTGSPHVAHLSVSLDDQDGAA